MIRTRKLTWAIVAVPVFYYTGLIGGSLTYPGYSHVTRYASELGASGAPYPWLFNLSIIAAGISAVVGAIELCRSLIRLDGSRVWSVLAGLSLALWGVAMIVGGTFPMPDERHGAYGLAIVGQLTPLAVFLALRAQRHTAAFRLFLLLVFVGSTSLLLVMYGVGQLVTTENVGLWQRAYSGSSILWLAVLGLWLMGKSESAAGNPSQDNSVPGAV